jgi:restriction endonuclease S subunit
MIKRLKIGDIANIRFGLYTQTRPAGSVLYLQARQFSDDGRQIFESDEFINLDRKNASHLLVEGDILLAGKGNRFFSSCYRKTSLPAVASSIFFVLSPDTKIVYPRYLEAFLNAPQSRAALMQIGGGTNILSIRKSELAAFEIPLPAMAIQKKIASVAAFHQQEIALAQEIIDRKRHLFTAIMSKLIN